MEIIKSINSNDGAVKYLQKLKSNAAIETTYVDYPNKHIICFSSQIGCVIGCIFCITGLRSKKDRYKRSLTKEELVTQCKNIIQMHDLNHSEKPILFSCMGEGEPLLNYKNVVAALSELGKNYQNSRLALSTSGIKPNLIKLLAHENFPQPFKLQVSIHSPNDEMRNILMPISSPLPEIVEAIRYYREVAIRPIDLNYVLFDNINDTEACATELAKLLGAGWHVKFNAFNSVPGSRLLSSTIETLSKFMAILEANGISTEFYKTNGSDIMAACGQLTYQNT